MGEKEEKLRQIIEQNEITEVIDMTNTACKRNQSDSDKSAVLGNNASDLTILTNTTEDPSIRLFTPIFTTPLDIFLNKACRKQKHSPILPGICYPFELKEYRFPCDLGTYIFWQGYSAHNAELDCKAMGISNE